jgi:urease accessory protein
MLARVRLMQMTSQAFPIGGYSQSYGLESAIDSGLVRDEAGVLQWIADVLEFSLTRYEIPMLHDFSAAWDARDGAALTALNAQFLATRESAELRAATVQMGFSLRQLLKCLPGIPDSLLEVLRDLEEPTLPCVWSGAASAFRLAPADSAVAYAWAWAENQALVAMKSVPIGQAAAQRVLLRVGELIAERAVAPPASPDTRSNFAPGLAILCSQHETQYSRLFRS